MSRLIYHYNIGLLRDYLQELSVNLYEMVPEQAYTVVNALWEVQVQRFELGKERLPDAEARLCSRIVYDIFRRANPEENQRLIIEKINGSSNENLFSILSGVIMVLEDAYGNVGEHTNTVYQFLGEDGLEGVEQAFRIALSKVSYNIFETLYYSNIYRAWGFFDKDTRNETVKKLIGSRIMHFVF